MNNEANPSPKPLNPLHVEIGGRIRECRRKAGLTQPDLAELAGLSSAQVISDLERGKFGASIATIIRLCDVLHTTPDYLLLGRKPAERYSELELQLLSLAETQKEMARRINSFAELLADKAGEPID